MLEVDPHAAPSLSPLALLRSLVRHRGLLVQMTKREVVGRYKGSALGVAWSDASGRNNAQYAPFHWRSA